MAEPCGCCIFTHLATHKPALGRASTQAEARSRLEKVMPVGGWDARRTTTALLCGCARGQAYAAWTPTRTKRDNGRENWNGVWGTPLSANVKEEIV